MIIFCWCSKLETKNVQEILFCATLHGCLIDYKAYKSLNTDILDDILTYKSLYNRNAMRLVSLDIMGAQLRVPLQSIKLN